MKMVTVQHAGFTHASMLLITESRGGCWRRVYRCVEATGDGKSASIMYSSSLAPIWILLILLHVSCCNSDDRPLVHTKYGPIVGKRVRMHQYNPNLQDVMQFLGIPYARAPVRDLRFRSPEKPEKWKIVRNCTHFAPVCPQSLDLPESQPVRPSMRRKWKAMKPLLTSMDEDCLYLNVYHPADVGR
ncbi:Neuroligin-3 [Branchiostoma belcheri]|nr:Neuroligin-3 [Branchiostoma belcheri]